MPGLVPGIRRRFDACHSSDVDGRAKLRAMTNESGEQPWTFASRRKKTRSATKCARSSRPTCRSDIRKKAAEGIRYVKEDIVTWQRILNKKGWAVPHWPKEWGGTGWSPVQLYIFQEEMQQAPAPEPLPFGTMMVGPVIIAFGREEQKKRYLPRIANLDDWWCQGFSEPGAGSDLASLKTSAKRDGDHYVVNGQKTWTTLRAICRLDLLPGRAPIRAPRSRKASRSC